MNGRLVTRRRLLLVARLLSPNRRLTIALACLLLALLAGASRAEADVTAFTLSNSLIVGGDPADNQITLQLAPGDSTRIEVLSGTTLVGSFARSTFASIVVNAIHGDDSIVLSGAFGPITEPATINGGPGNDTIRGGAGADELNGGINDDRIIWSPDDGNDVINGNDGFDTFELNGSSEAEGISIERIAGQPRFSAFVKLTTIDVNTIEDVVVNAGDGDDTIDAAGDLAPIVKLTFDGGPGNDVLRGSNGNDVLLGGPGRDSLKGLEGDDVIQGGPDGDSIEARAGDVGHDLIEGNDGVDDMVSFTGSISSDQITIAPNGNRVLLTRGAILLDMAGVETIFVDSRSGDDEITGAKGLADNGVTQLHLNGGDSNDVITGGDTNDVLEGGGGNDTLIGGAGNDRLFGGPGADSIDGGAGDDVAFFAALDESDEFTGGDGDDRANVSGDAGNDVLLVAPSTIPGLRFAVVLNGNGDLVQGAAERIDIITGDGIDRITMDGDLADVDIDIDAGAGADIINSTPSARITVNGKADVDQLNFNASDGPVSVTPSTIAVAGITRVTHTEVEDVRFTRLIGSLPTIAISSPTADPATSATTTFLKLAGAATDVDGLASVNVTNDRGGTVTAAGTTAWVARDVPLAAGTNVLTAIVRDTAGNEVSDTLTVTVSAFTYSMAEGATGSFFDTDILIANPNTVEAPVTVTYLRGDGVAVPQSLTLAPTSRTTIRVDEIAGLESAEVSSTVTSTAALPLVVERTMRWDATGYGSHTEKATDGPETTWLFAEGAQGFFDTYVLLANPQPTENTATVTFLVENGAPVVTTFTLAPTSRRTIGASSIPELANQSFGIAVTFAQPGAVERAMYFGTPVFNAGHESAGVNEPSTRWFLAEGATGSFFTTFVLLANPGTLDASAAVTFLPEGGTPVTRTKIVPAGARITLNIAAEDPSLASSAVATAVESTQPILVERAQYWPFTPDRWHEAHNSFGSTTVALKWGLAEGRVGGPEGYQTFILLANADPAQAADVRITFLRTDGTTVVRSITVAPSSRLTVRANEVTELSDESFGALIEVTSGPGIFVERALYSNAQGVVFAAGTNALATRLP
jgi:Ca2+-binding RTX toxin-like protein